jgi:hypothetical protein
MYAAISAGDSDKDFQQSRAGRGSDAGPWLAGRSRAARGPTSNDPSMG